MPSGHSISNAARIERIDTCWGEWSEVRENHQVMKMVAWAEHPQTMRYVNRNVSGDEHTSWIDWAVRTFLDLPAGRGLSLGCGSGFIEREMLDKGYAEAMDGVDISGKAIAHARRSAGERRLAYGILDLNCDNLESRVYDFVVSGAALHHVANLEHCFAQVHRSLKEGGILIMHEYVGPDRFQWPDARLELINRVYSALPEKYKHNHMTGLRQRTIERRPLHHMITADPSEAIRSSELLDVASLFFDEVERRELGGGLLHPLLEGIVGNFDEDDVYDAALMNMLIALERSLTLNGYLSSDFIVSVARRGEAAMTPGEAAVKGQEKMDIITRQEDDILELNRRLEEAERQAGRLVRAVEAQLKEIYRLRLQNEHLLEENGALKSNGPLRTVRFLRAKLRQRRKA